MVDERGTVRQQIAWKGQMMDARVSSKVKCLLTTKLIVLVEGVLDIE